MQIVQVTVADLTEVRPLFWEYLQWANANLAQAFDISFDIAAMLEGDITGLQKCCPPRGRLLLATVDGATAGCASMKTIGKVVAELSARSYGPPTAARGSAVPWCRR